MKNKKGKNDQEIEKGLKLLAKTSIIVFIGVILSKLFTYAYRVIVARFYGPELYGLYSLTLMIFGWLTALASLGLVDGLVRYTSLYRGQKQENKINFIFKTSLIISIFSSILAAFLLFFLAEFISISIFHNAELIIFLKFFAILIPFAIISRLYLSIIRAYEKISVYSFLNNIVYTGTILISILLFIFLGIEKNLSIIFSYFLGPISVLIIAYLFFRFKLSKLLFKKELDDKEKAKTRYALLSYSWPLMFLGIFTTIFYWVDSFTIGYFQGVTEVGFYNAAIPIVALLGILPDLFMQLFLPLITKEYSKNNSEVITQLSKQVSKWIFLLNIPVFLLIFIFPGAIINILFGEQYLVAETALRILSVGGIISSVIGLSCTLISAIGRSKLVLGNIILVTIINLLLNFLLVPEYGINGAAIATTISWIIFSLIYLIEVKFLFKFFPVKRKIIRIFLISLIPAIILVYLKSFFIINFFTLVLLGGSFFLLYIFLIFLTGCLDKNDVMIVETLRNRIKLNKNDQK
jgi:O-antigen/teichoic acid export membrane protein